MALDVISTHLYPVENAVEHHADRFESIQDGSTAIFRRGQPFYFGVKFNRPLDNIKDIVRIVLVTGEPLYILHVRTDIIIIITRPRNISKANNERPEGRNITVFRSNQHRFIKYDSG